MKGFTINWDKIIDGLDEMGVITDFHKAVMGSCMIPKDLNDYLSKMILERIAATRVGDEEAPEAVKYLKSKLKVEVQKELAVNLLKRYSFC
jgi:hypothetical protein